MKTSCRDCGALLSIYDMFASEAGGWRCRACHARSDDPARIAALKARLEELFPTLKD